MQFDRDAGWHMRSLSEWPLVSSLKSKLVRNITVIRVLTPILAGIIGTFSSLIPGLYTRYAVIAAVSLILIIVLYWTYTFENTYRDYINIFRNIDKVNIILSHRVDEYENSVSIWDLKCSYELKTALKRVGKSESNIFTHHFPNNSPPPNVSEFDKDLIVIGGPAVNHLSSTINGAMKDVPNSLYFHFEENAEPGRRFFVSDKSGDIIKIHFKTRPSSGRHYDHAVIYVGPNPVNANRWLIWISGLGPYATYAAGRMMTRPDFARVIGDQLDEKMSFCFAVIRYEFDADDDAKIENGSVTQIITSSGRLPFP